MKIEIIISKDNERYSSTTFRTRRRGDKHISDFIREQITNRRCTLIRHGNHIKLKSFIGRKLSNEYSIDIYVEKNAIEKLLNI